VRAVGSGARRKARGNDVRRVDLAGCTLVPGLVDLHTHGAAGVDFVEASPEELEGSMAHYLRHGVTALLVSVYPSSWKKSLAVLRRISSAIRDGHGRGVALGIHLEGPFVSPRKPGALPRRHFRQPSTRDASKLLDACQGFAKTVTLAPELKRSAELVRFFRDRGVVPAFGHSDADYEETKAALTTGVRYATHLFNAMNGVHHRAPGAVTALLEHPEVVVEVIADGCHVDPPVLRLINAMKSRDKVVLVSDSVMPCGLEDGRYRFAGSDVVLDNGRITQPDGRLAGSALTLDRAIRVEVNDAGASLEDAVLFASQNPARTIGVERTRGSIAPGRRADFALLDSRLHVKATWLAGELVHQRGKL
jgi:N-acetylglucosamine-6-phosphate deacetylase